VFLLLSNAILYLVPVTDENILSTQVGIFHVEPKLAKVITLYTTPLY